MIRRSIFRLANALCLVMFLSISLGMRTQQSGVDSPQPVTLAVLQDRYRPVLVFAPSTTPLFIEQMRALAEGGSDLHERDILVIPMLLTEDRKFYGVVLPGSTGSVSSAEQAAARRRFHIHPNDFTVVLIGKDGGEKLRSRTPISLETLRSTIDAMPMRQEEMRSRPKP